MAPKSEGTGYGKLIIRNPEDRAQGVRLPLSAILSICKRKKVDNIK